jgi:hypothetical protein
VVPVTVTGGRDAMRKGSRIIWPVTVTVDFGSPIATWTDRRGSGRADRRVRAAMDARLARESL